MVQQRKHAWINRKKKPKSEMTLYKGGLNCGRTSYPAKGYYKNPTSRHHETTKTSYTSDPTSNNHPKKGASNSNKMSQSQFLPPILTITGDSSLSLATRQPSLLDVESVGREPLSPDVWRFQMNVKTPEKDLQGCTSLKDAPPLGAAGGRFHQTLQVVPSCWDQRTTVLLQNVEDLSKSQEKSTPSPELYRSCLLVITPRRGLKKESSAQRTSEAKRGVMTAGYRTQRRLANKCIPTWRSCEESKQNIKDEGKRSSRDSAFGTDTDSETAVIDVELGLEMCKTEMSHFTQERIIDWILQVNDALFSSHSKEASRGSLTEQDTSIKFVYEGD
ncbi:Hypothetical predicted protein [Pelobates cultripes]|nr:Hypothetical predicted protein [Pelobates cultripes]